MAQGPAQALGGRHRGRPRCRTDATGGHRSPPGIPFRHPHASRLSAVHPEGGDPRRGDDDDPARSRRGRQAALSIDARPLRSRRSWRYLARMRRAVSWMSIVALAALPAFAMQEAGTPENGVATGVRQIEEGDYAG